MGCIRFILALMVLIGHAHNSFFGWVGVKGALAVQVFYIISGFYITLILNGKYNNYRLFLTNRFLKIVPFYWLILILTILTCFIGLFMNYNSVLTNYLNNPHNLKPISLIYIAITQITIFGQNSLLFMGSTVEGYFKFSTNFRLEETQLYEYCFIPQAWTLCVEFLFYIIAPLIVKKSWKFISSVLIFSLIIRFILYKNGLNHDPFTYRFFPCELALFLAGSLSFKIYNTIKSKNIPKGLIIASQIYPIVFLIYQYIPIEESYKKALLLITFPLIVPLIFLVYKNNQKDRFIGELSYPIYISHFLIINIIDLIGYGKFIAKYYTVITSILTILFCIICYYYILLPLDKFRQKRVNENISAVKTHTGKALSSGGGGNV